MCPFLTTCHRSQTGIFFFNVCFWPYKGPLLTTCHRSRTCIVGKETIVIGFLTVCMGSTLLLLVNYVFLSLCYLSVIWKSGKASAVGHCYLFSFVVCLMALYLSILNYLPS